MWSVFQQFQLSSLGIWDVVKQRDVSMIADVQCGSVRRMKKITPATSSTHPTVRGHQSLFNEFPLCEMADGSKHIAVKIPRTTVVLTRILVLLCLLRVSARFRIALLTFGENLW